MDEQHKLAARIREMTGWPVPDKIDIITDTSEWINIYRGQIIRLDGHDYLVKGNEYEARFGISDQPKYWVFSVYDMETGATKIIKTVFNEEFYVHIGVFRIHCVRSPEKEARVLDLVRGDRRFMQGHTILDTRGNHVRVIDYIRGKNLFQYIFHIDKKHEVYFHEDLPGILWQLADSIEAIELLHRNETCHGDIRNDHIVIDAETGQYRWIDFDLNQHVSDFDVWSIGNIINYAVGKGITSFANVKKSREFSDNVKESLTVEDASGFFEYRLMNLKKLYPYIPPRLHDILLHFTIRPRRFYENVGQLLGDYREMLATEFPRSG